MNEDVAENLKLFTISNYSYAIRQWNRSQTGLVILSFDWLSFLWIVLRILDEIR